jgi:hypothetical protein
METKLINAATHALQTKDYYRARHILPLLEERKEDMRIMVMYVLIKRLLKQAPVPVYTF